MERQQPDYYRESPDKRFAAWYGESWYYGHHYRFSSYSPWHTCGNGTRYQTEEEARKAVDTFMDVWVPSVRGEQCKYCTRGMMLDCCFICGCLCCQEHHGLVDLGTYGEVLMCQDCVWK